MWRGDVAPLSPRRSAPAVPSPPMGLRVARRASRRAAASTRRRRGLGWQGVVHRWWEHRRQGAGRIGGRGGRVPGRVLGVGHKMVYRRALART
jgi:hypothetical protein